MRICDYCKKECKKTPFGSCVILCKENIILCIDCNLKKKQNDKFNYNYRKLLNKFKILNYLKKRESNF